ncbi:MAG: LysM peptidoglycan-binding domain-containing protein [Halanaerobiales bacterium]|nr:LysM peptidoglycan-binding domain-containing protein [Halanaerobiales bacterium]
MYKGNAKLTRQNEKKAKYSKLLVLTVIILSMILLISVLSFKAMTEKEIYYKDIEIKNGQTLWQIAESEFGSDSNIRKYVYQIKQINNLNDSNLSPGQIIKVPIEKEV